VRRISPITVAGLLLVLALLFRGGGFPVIGSQPPFTTDHPCVLAVHDASPQAVFDLQSAHPGQADVLTSLADGSVRQRVTASGGEWRLLSQAKSSDSDLNQEAQWVRDAATVWRKAGGKVPWLVAAGKSGGYSGPIPDGSFAQAQADTIKLLSQAGVK